MINNKTLELETKSWLPIFPDEIGTIIFGRLIQNPTWATLGCAARVCKDWRTEILTIFPIFSEISSIFSRQILHVHPIKKFLLKIVGDCRDSIPYENLMPMAYIQQCIVELEKPCSEGQDICKSIKYAEYAKHAEDANFISMVQSLNGKEPFSKGGEKLALELGIFLPWQTRERMCDAINKAVEAVGELVVEVFLLFVGIVVLLSVVYTYSDFMHTLFFNEFNKFFKILDLLVLSLN